MAANVSEGETRIYTRTFTNADVRAFADLSKDEGEQHLVAGEDGTLMVHGLLTATLPTKIGGDMDYIARRMEFEFLKPVYTDEEITCEVTIDHIEQTDGRTKLEATGTCTNEAGETVLRFETNGVIFG